MTQRITIEGLSGPYQITAPDGWNFNKTDAIVWSKMLSLAREQVFKTKREEAVNAGQIEVLANILANSLGMAAYYWVRQVREIIVLDDERRISSMPIGTKTIA